MIISAGTGVVQRGKKHNIKERDRKDEKLQFWEGGVLGGTTGFYIFSSRWGRHLWVSGRRVTCSEFHFTAIPLSLVNNVLEKDEALCEETC